MERCAGTGEEAQDKKHGGRAERGHHSSVVVAERNPRQTGLGWIVRSMLLVW